MASVLQIATTPDAVRRIQRVQTVTIVWMSVEAVVSLFAAWRARSPALLAFGGDSTIELFSAVVVLWRFRASAAHEEVERRAARVAGALLFALAAYVAVTSVTSLLGYGEQKDVVPVIGQSTPTVQYYVRPLHAKFSVPQITQYFTALGITTPDQFFKIICDCVICKNIIGKDLNAFAQFGEIHYSRPQSKRASQTPAAAKRCRYHFLLNRARERDYVRATALKAIADNCNAAADQWHKTILANSIEHLRTWAEVLS